MHPTSSYISDIKGTKNCDRNHIAAYNLPLNSFRQESCHLVSAWCRSSRLTAGLIWSKKFTLGSNIKPKYLIFFYDPIVNLPIDMGWFFFLVKMATSNSSNVRYESSIRCPSHQYDNSALRLLNSEFGNKFRKIICITYQVRLFCMSTLSRLS